MRNRNGMWIGWIGIVLLLAGCCPNGWTRVYDDRVGWTCRHDVRFGDEKPRSEARCRPPKLPSVPRPGGVPKFALATFGGRRGAR